MTEDRTGERIVVSAHAADFVWRAGGAIALGTRRGVQAVRNGGRKGITQAEAYQRVFPVVGEELI